MITIIIITYNAPKSLVTKLKGALRQKDYLISKVINIIIVVNRWIVRKLGRVSNIIKVNV